MSNPRNTRHYVEATGQNSAPVGRHVAELVDGLAGIRIRQQRCMAVQEKMISIVYRCVVLGASNDACFTSARSNRRRVLSFIQQTTTERCTVPCGVFIHITPLRSYKVTVLRLFFSVVRRCVLLSPSHMIE